jgi:hypothetical protein
VTGDAGFALSDVRKEGQRSVWGSSRLSVRCDMTVRSPRNRRPNARKLLSDYLSAECKGEDPVDWSHAARLMCVQDFSSAAGGGGQSRRESVRFGF